MSSRPVRRWLFGKLPAQGDFVSRGVDQQFRDTLDCWLSEEMQAAKAAYTDFEERYTHAPACHFVDVDEDGQWSGGAMVASVDRVGRHFPMILCEPAASAGDAAEVSAACLAALHEAFSSGWDADSLYGAALTRVAVPWVPEAAQWALVGEDGPAYVANERYPKGIVTVMLEMAL